eukprot:NODE_54_length_2359_cov_207.483941.p1 GENE.NODE_54_length_2359_cov_207.483941~~NODE_54_length_2359_cov_207.483941.p1  ORF type:complete len:705 (+),score=124.95 NODE_54_length_2359_cov_207.483941:3-2117(+)
MGQRVLRTQIENTNLERLCLEWCDIGPGLVEAVRDFVATEHLGNVKTLRLAFNPIGDGGFRQLLQQPSDGGAGDAHGVASAPERAHVLSVVRKLDLQQTGLSAEALRIFAFVAAESRLPLTVNHLSLDHNDLSEAGNDSALMAALAAHLAEPECTLTELRLVSSRLNEAQLLELLRGIRVSPRLHRVGLQRVTLPANLLANARDERRNELLSTVADPRCSVKYLDLTAVDYDTMNRSLTAAAKGRERAKLETLEREGKIRVGECRFDALNMQRGYLSVRVRDVLPGNHHLPWRANLETTLGVIEQVVPERNERTLVWDTENFFSQCDTGHWFDVKLSLRGARIALGGRRPQLADSGSNCRAYRGLSIVFWRPENNTVLLMRERDETTALKALRERLNTGVFADHLAAEDRFQKGVSRKRLQKFYTCAQVFENIDICGFSDAETEFLASLDQVAGYAAYLGKPFLLKWQEATLRRVRGTAVFREVVAEFQSELRRRRGGEGASSCETRYTRRAESGESAADSADSLAGQSDLEDASSLERRVSGANGGAAFGANLSLLERKCSHQSVMGGAEQFLLFKQPVDSFRHFLKSFSNGGIHDLSPTFSEQDILPVDGQDSFLRVLPVIVSEDEIQPLTQLPTGFTLNTGYCVWTPLEELASALQSYSAAANFPDIVQVIARQLPAARVHLVRVEQGRATASKTSQGEQI